jgi:site-specific DNA-methyltransferase (adenine-specific)
MSSESVEWGTPIKLFRHLDSYYNFTVDVCASADNAKCLRYFDISVNGLLQNWGSETAWMNPPYGTKIIDGWMWKAADEVEKGARIVALVPSRTDTKWFHNYVYRCPYADFRFPEGRFRFEDFRPQEEKKKSKGDGSTFPSMLVEYYKGERIINKIDLSPAKFFNSRKVA